uniref:Uncharacterized protein n=1 Tax=Glossina palpalis gambiensis TaxID=67801 RepID=A0A1B0BLS4_9MUSC
MINVHTRACGITHSKIKSAFRQDLNAIRLQLNAFRVKIVISTNEGDKTKNYVLKYYAGTVYLEGDVNELLMDLFSCSSSSLSRPKAMRSVYACVCVPLGYHDTSLPLNWDTTEIIRQPNYPKWTTAPRSSCSTMPAPASIAVSRRCTNLLHLVNMLATLFCLFNSSWKLAAIYSTSDVNE